MAMETLKVIIAGSRHLARIADVLDGYRLSGFEATEIVSGACPTGPDEIGAWYGRHVLGVPVKEFPAEWNRFGNLAGPLRNHQMAEYADALVLVWDGASRGSANMLREAEQFRLKIYQHVIK